MEKANAASRVAGTYQLMESAMSKPTTNTVTWELLKALLQDLEGALWYDTVLGVKRDLNEISRRISTRGLTLAMVDMPAVAKLYDKGLSSGFFQWADYPHSLRRKNDKALLQGLIELSFREDGNSIHPEPDLVKATRQILLIFKKVKMECSPAVIRKYHHEFFELDGTLPLPHLDWDTKSLSMFGRSVALGGDDLFFQTQARAQGFGDGSRFGNFCQLLDRVAFEFTPHVEVRIHHLFGRHGPGAVSDLSGSEDKYSFPTWSERLASVFPPGTMLASSPEWEPNYENSWGGDCSAKLIAVPKTLDKPRLIASEPTANMWCQQALLTWLREHLPSAPRRCIDFHSQQLSKDAALQASSDGLTVTVDLKSASDYLSLWVVERMFRSNESFLTALWASRTPSIRSEVVSKSLDSMRKYAAQGCAMTFPVQSLVYGAVATAAVIMSRRVRGRQITTSDIVDAAKRVRIFGDDIIIPRESYQDLVDMMTFLGLHVNVGKTHTGGYFRESCGMDAYSGVSVTPFYLPVLQPDFRCPRQTVSYIAGINNAVDMGYFALAETLAKKIPTSILRRVLVSEVPQSGLWIHPLAVGNSTPPQKRRFNSHLQREEYLTLVPYEARKREERETSANLLQRFTEGVYGSWIPGGVHDMGTRECSPVGFKTSSRTRLRVRWVSGD